jgi:hypothetical protein
MQSHVAIISPNSLALFGVLISSPQSARTRKASEHWQGHSSLHPPSPKQSAWKNFVPTLSKLSLTAGRSGTGAGGDGDGGRLPSPTEPTARSEPLSKRTLATTEAATLRQK